MRKGKTLRDRLSDLAVWAIIAAFVLVVAVLFWWMMNRPCETYAWTSIKNVPARCATHYGIGR